MPSTPPPRRPQKSPSGSRSSGALLDPYGIYGTRTATRLRDSRRRRQSQSIFLLLALIVAAAVAVAAVKTRRIATTRATSEQQLVMPVMVAPVWIEPSSKTPGALLIAGEDGRLIKVSDAENARGSDAPESEEAATVANTT